MFGINAGYDSRPMATGRTDTGVTVTDRNTVFFQQVAAGLEAVSDGWNFNAYALIPVGTEVYRINSNYFAAALDTYGLDVGYSFTPDFRASVGYYYQHSPLEEADGSGVDGRLAYDISNGLVAGVNVSYDQAFETRVSADLKYRFGADGYGAPSKKKAWNKPTIKGLSETVKSRDVRVHDASSPSCPPGVVMTGCPHKRGTTKCSSQAIENGCPRSWPGCNGYGEWTQITSKGKWQCASAV